MSATDPRTEAATEAFWRSAGKPWERLTESGKKGAYVHMRAALAAADAVDTRVQQLTEALRHAERIIRLCRISASTPVPNTAFTLGQEADRIAAVLAEVDASPKEDA